MKPQIGGQERPGASSKKKARSGDRRAELIQIAGEIFAQKGFMSTTIRDVAEAAGIQSGSLYHHFASKDEMVEELLSEYWTKLLERYRAVVADQPDELEAIRGLIRESVILLDECHFALRMMLTDWVHLVEIFPFMDESLQESQKIWLEVLERGHERGVIDPAHDLLILYRTIMSSVSGTVRWFRPQGPITVESLADQMAYTFMSGIETRS